MIKISWMITMLLSLLGLMVLIFGVAGANGAPQEASAAAIGIALAVIPYCFTRAAQEIFK